MGISPNMNSINYMILMNYRKSAYNDIHQVIQ
jgi:hypothetical protein